MYFFLQVSHDFHVAKTGHQAIALFAVFFCVTQDQSLLMRCLSITEHLLSILEIFLANVCRTCIRFSNLVLL